MKKNLTPNATDLTWQRDQMFCCEESGHHSSDCPLKDKTPKEKWAHKKSPQMAQELNKGINSKSQQSNENETKNDQSKKQSKSEVHWIRSQHQGCQTCMTAQAEVEVDKTLKVTRKQDKEEFFQKHNQHCIAGCRINI